MIYSKILSIGSYLPNKIVTNNDLSKIINTNDEWIKKRTGIKFRRIAKEDYETTTNMGFLAAQDAIKNAKVKLLKIDTIIVTTSSPDKIFPSTACCIQKKLKIKDCVAFDIQAACSGFIYAINIADNLIKTGSSKKILIIGSEKMSKITDWKDRSSCILFGDGAGAIILESSKKPGILYIKLHSKTKHNNILYLNAKKKSYIKMNGKIIFKMAVKYLKDINLKTIKKTNIKINEIDWIIPHQANIRIINKVAKYINIPLKNIITTIEEYANTSGASIPITMHHAIKIGKIKHNQLLLLEAFGAGLTYGIVLVKY
ncbi:MAG: beta-ketoacyl-ACP synthase III [Enterobacteriaceae bacterium]|nr:beta-ketoacyl-ACP synthase III [Enterobacteriaceae bacterium]